MRENLIKIIQRAKGKDIPLDEYSNLWPDGILDSIEVVEIIVSIQEEMGVDISEEHLFSRKTSPFKTLKNLEEFIESQK